MKTSSRVIPISPRSSERSWPARPTNGRPWRSSSAPGASPTNIRSASALPAPKTVLVPRLGERAERAVGNLAVELDQPLAPRLRVAHDPPGLPPPPFFASRALRRVSLNCAFVSAWSFAFRASCCRRRRRSSRASTARPAPRARGGSRRAPQRRHSVVSVPAGTRSSKRSPQASQSNSYIGMTGKLHLRGAATPRAWTRKSGPAPATPTPDVWILPCENWNATTPTQPTPLSPLSRVASAIVGAGRAGGSIAAAARAAGLEVEVGAREVDPAARRSSSSACPTTRSAPACERIASAARARGAFVGHVSGATGARCARGRGRRRPRDVLPPPAPDDPDGRRPTSRGAPCAVSGSSAEASRQSRRLSPTRLGMQPFEVPEEGRAAYHAAASMASNFLIALEESAARADGGRGRSGCARSSGPARPPLRCQLGGRGRGGAHRADRPRRRGDRRPPSRGARQTAPELRPLYEALAERTRELGGESMTAFRSSAPSPTCARRSSPRGGDGRVIGLVPTMGFLHAGHVSLIEAARERSDVVVMSLFVNPTQFGEGEDLDSYPRDEERDLAAGRRSRRRHRLRARAPRRSIRPASRPTSRSRASPTSSAAIPRGAAPRHFRGVTTVVAKLLNMADPDLVFFGQKDAQQAIVIRRMARDLDFRAEVVVMPTVREPDGLALSLAKRLSRRLGARARHRAQPRARDGALSRRGERRRRRARRRAGRSSPTPGSSPSTSRRATRTTSSRLRASTDGPFWWPSPRGSAGPASSTTWSSTPAIPPTTAMNKENTECNARC